MQNQLNTLNLAVSNNHWQVTPTQSDRERLDNLIGQALVDHTVHERLIVQHDPTLLDAFGLSEDTRRWLSAIRASTLKEFAQAIVAATTPYHGRSAAHLA